MRSALLKKPLVESDLDLYEQYYAAEARNNFFAFRRFMDPTLKVGWWVRELSAELQQFYADMIAGKRPKLVIMAPPQHGKSRTVQEFIAWVAGLQADWKTIFASYSDELGVDANNFLQRLYVSDRYHLTFPETIINSNNVVTIAERAKRNSSLIEYIGRRGSFRNTTVNGQITGKGLDLGVIDDPMKGRAEAQSPTIRNKTWMWFTDDFFNRFSEYAGLIIIMTRWHLDDPVGRFIDMFPDARVLVYPAIAPHDTETRKAGEPLFPEHKSFEFLMERKRVYTNASWQSLYQQNPIEVGGGMFPIDKVKIVRTYDPKEIKRSVRYWDKAGTDDGGAYTAGVLMHSLKDGRYIIEDVIHGQWNAFKREARIKAAAEQDAAMHKRVEVWVEQEPGSGGKESAERTIAMLAGHRVYADRVTGKKEIRAEPYAAQFQGGNILVLASRWVRSWLDEHESFPAGKYKDQVDASAGAFAKLQGKTYAYDTSMKWVTG